MNLKVFIQSESVSKKKPCHNEMSVQWWRTKMAARSYPDGFIVGPTSADGSNFDSLVIIEQHFRAGDLVDCKVTAPMQQMYDCVVVWG